MQTQEEINADAIARLEKEIVRYYEIANHLMDIRNKLELKRAAIPQRNSSLRAEQATGSHTSSKS